MGINDDLIGGTKGLICLPGKKAKYVVIFTFRLGCPYLKNHGMTRGGKKKTKKLTSEKIELGRP